ncbi:MAG: hypothetical protein DHS20C02_05050 [Micavibrio sp.]|nr:MAG: hypothetical protein DHS20C02_05050 [Micavibrio sp.]
MSAVQAQDGLFYIDPAMRGSFIVSGLFHVAVVVVLSLSLPYISKDYLMVSNPVSVEIVDVSEIAQTNKPSPPKKPEPEKKMAPPQEKPAPPKVEAEKPPDLTKPKPPDVKEEVAEPRDAVPPPKPLEKKAEKPKPPKKKPPVKKAEAAPKDDFASLLKNLTPDAAEETESAETPDATASEVSQIANLADRITISEMDMVKRGLMPCWNIPIGAKNAEDLVVEVRVLMNPDRTVQQATILNQSRYNRDSHYRAAAEAALRALRNPRCAPLQLPPDKYEQWKTTVIEFNPQNML